MDNQAGQEEAHQQRRLKIDAVLVLGCHLREPEEEQQAEHEQRVMVGIDDGHSAYVQLIARSATDTIHVGHIAERFGGGGHPRAAAAHITDLTLQQTYDRFLAIVPGLIQPATTVRQIFLPQLRFQCYS